MILPCVKIAWLGRGGDGVLSRYARGCLAPLPMHYLRPAAAALTPTFVHYHMRHLLRGWADPRRIAGQGGNGVASGTKFAQPGELHAASASVHLRAYHAAPMISSPPSVSPATSAGRVPPMLQNPAAFTPLSGECGSAQWPQVRHLSPPLPPSSPPPRPSLRLSIHASVPLGA